MSKRSHYRSGREQSEPKGWPPAPPVQTRAAIVPAALDPEVLAFEAQARRRARTVQAIRGGLALVAVFVGAVLAVVLGR
jgi:hypothetical protein